MRASSSSNVMPSARISRSVRSLKFFAMRFSASAHCALARFPVFELFTDPGISFGHTFAQWRARLPMQDALDHSVIAVTAGHTTRRGGIVLTFQFDAGDGFNDVHQFVHGNQFARTQVD